MDDIIRITMTDIDPVKFILDTLDKTQLDQLSPYAEVTYSLNGYPEIHVIKAQYSGMLQAWRIQS